jgi:hypothetical protein
MQVAPMAANPADPSLNPPLTANAIIRVLTFTTTIVFFPAVAVNEL